jgi:hypothetical protein
MTSVTNKIAGLVFSLCISAFVLASGPESYLLFSLTSQNTARLGIVNTTNRDLNLSITNVSGEVFFSKAVSGKHNYFQMLDLNKMPGGEYSVKLSGLDETCMKKFIVTNSTVQLIKDEKESLPSFNLMNDKTLTVSYFNSQKNTVNILLEKDNEVVFEDKGLLDMALSKRYSLKKLPGGEYTVKLKSGEKTYSFPLVLN